MPICRPEGSWVCCEDCAPGWRRVWYSKSSNTARERLKPVVLTFAKLLAITSIWVCCASSPVLEIHKQLILLAIGIFQLFEGKLVARVPKFGAAVGVIIKIILSTLLLEHTGELGINSSYFPIFYLPVVGAAIAFGPVATLAWTTMASLA